MNAGQQGRPVRPLQRLTVRKARPILGACLVFLYGLGVSAGDKPLSRVETLSAEALLKRASDVDLHSRERELAAGELVSRDGAAEVLVKELASERSIVRQVSATLLGEIRSLDAEDALLDATGRKDILTAANAVRSLAQTYTRLPMAELLKRLQPGMDERSLVRARAAAASIPLAYEKSEDLALPEAVEKRLLALLSHEDDPLRAAAAEALGYAAGEAIGKTLLELVDREKSVPVLRAACRALARLRPPLKGTPLLTLLEAYDDPMLALDASVALHGLGYEGLHRALGVLLKHERASVREAAASAAGRVGDPYSVQDLVEAFSDRSWRVRLAALEALEKIKTADLSGVIDTPLKDEDPRVRARAALILHEQGMMGADRPLIEDLKSDNVAAQAAAAEALGKMKSRAAVTGLGMALRSKDTEVAGRAAEALGNINSKDALQPLAGALRDSRPSVSHAARMALKTIFNSDPGPDPELWAAWEKKVTTD